MCEVYRQIPIGEQLFIGGWTTAFMEPKQLYTNAVTEGLIDPKKISEEKFANRTNLQHYHNDGPSMSWSDDPEELEERFPGAIGVACLARNNLFRDHSNQEQNRDLESYHKQVNKAQEHLYNNPWGLRRIRELETLREKYLY
jgi:hypothetical protein